MTRFTYLRMLGGKISRAVRTAGGMVKTAYLASILDNRPGVLAEPTVTHETVLHMRVAEGRVMVVTGVRVGGTDELSTLLTLRGLCLTEGSTAFGAGSMIRRAEHITVGRAAFDVCRTQRFSTGSTQFCMLRTDRLITHPTATAVIGTNCLVTDRATGAILRAHPLSAVGTLLEMCFAERAVTDLTICRSLGTVIPAATVAGNCVVTTACRLTRRTLDSILATERVIAGRTPVEMCCTERL